MPSSAHILTNVKISGPLQFCPYFPLQTTLIFTQALPKYMKTRFITLQINSAGNIPATATCVDLHFHQNSIPPKLNIDFTLDRYKVFRRSICTEKGSEQVGSVQVLGAEVVHVGPIQMLGPKQNYSSKHLDRTSSWFGTTASSKQPIRCPHCSWIHMIWISHAPIKFVTLVSFTLRT